MGTYVLDRANGGGYFFVLKAENHEKILTSEIYASKAGAENGIQSCRVNSPFDDRYLRKTSKDEQFFFVLKAANNEPIGTSEMYKTQAARDTGIASVKKNGPTSPVLDRT